MSKIEQLKLWIEEQNQDPFLHYALAKEYENIKAEDLALKKYAYLVESFPNYVGTYYHFAKLLWNCGQKDQALHVAKDGIQVCTKVKDMHSKSELNALLLRFEID